MFRHTHNFNNDRLICSCGRKMEEEYRGELTHPGKPTSERVWELRHKLFLIVRGKSGN